MNIHSVLHCTHRKKTPPRVDIGRVNAVSTVRHSTDPIVVAKEGRFPSSHIEPDDEVAHRQDEDAGCEHGRYMGSGDGPSSDCTSEVRESWLPRPRMSRSSALAVPSSRSRRAAMSIFAGRLTRP